MSFTATIMSRRALVALPLAFVLLAGIPAKAQDVSFARKTVTIMVGTTAGGSTDLSARLLAPFFSKYLPGTPDVVVKNQPGAHGLTVMNYIAQQAKADGLTTVVGSSSQIDPINYRVPQAKYDPAKFVIIGGVGIGGTIMIIRNDQVAALTDKSKPPVAMGSVSGIPRSGMQMTAWGVDYLGWNAKWVAGYRGTPDLILALQRGEIGMTSLANTEVRPELLDTSQYTINVQSGSNRGTVPASLTSIAKVPLFAPMVQDKIKDPLAQKAFEYWRAISSVSKWAALPPNTPKPTADAYHAAFRSTAKDPTFIARGKKISEDVSAMSPEDVTATVQTLAALPPEAFTYMKEMLAKQGLKVVARKKKKKKKE
jgi:hypothetical protein